MQGPPDARAVAARACAWGGTLLFVASLAYFLFAYAVTYGEITDAPPGDAARAVLVDVILFSGFALHHSVFARERIRAQVARVVPPMLERSLYVWVASALFLGVCAWWQPVPGIAWQVPGPLRWVMVAVQAGAIALILRSAVTIDVFELSGVRQLSDHRPNVVFTTNGPYGWVRHPIYLGWLLLVFGAPLMTMTRLVFAAISSIYLFVAIPFEERSLRATTGDAYRRYAEQVRWRVVPGIY